MISTNDPLADLKIDFYSHKDPPQRVECASMHEWPHEALQSATRLQSALCTPESIRLPCHPRPTHLRIGSSMRWRLSAQRATATSLSDACSTSMKVGTTSWSTAARHEGASRATTSNTFWNRSYHINTEAITTGNTPSRGRCTRRLPRRISNISLTTRSRSRTHCTGIWISTVTYWRSWSMQALWIRSLATCSSGTTTWSLMWWCRQRHGRRSC